MSTHFRDTGLGEFLGTVNAKPTTDYIKENYPRRGSLLDVYEYLRKEQGGGIDTLKTTTEIMQATGRARTTVLSAVDTLQELGAIIVSPVWIVRSTVEGNPHQIYVGDDDPVTYLPACDCHEMRSKSDRRSFIAVEAVI